MTARQFQLLYYALRFKHPSCLGVSARIPLAQAYLESSDPKTGIPFTSNLALNTHNIFGMQYPNGRAAAGLTTAIDKDAHGFAVFKSFYDAIDDYFYFLENWKITTDAQLDTFVHTRYATDPKYYPKVMAMTTRLQKLYISPNLFIAGTIAAGTASAVAISAIVKALK
jgi:flagellum-specific peptidoglycan hydrolase FlgJ